MENTDINPSQEETNLELDTTSEELTEEGTQGGDPLDAIEDPEVLRAEAKKLRAIANRVKKPEAKKEEVKPVDETKGDYLTRSDYAKIATRDAKKMVPPEIAEVWDELLPIAIPGYDPLDADSIAKNMAERFAVYQTRTTSKQTKPDTTVLTATNTVTGGGTRTTTRTDSDARFTKSKQPDQWYSKKA